MALANDFWVTEPDCLLAFYSGMTLHIPKVFDKDHDADSPYHWVSDPNAELEYGDAGVLQPLDERFSLENMIIASTLNGEYGNFLDDEIGFIQVGKLADLIVLDQNLFQIEIDRIPSTKILTTFFFEGKQVYSA